MAGRDDLMTVTEAAERLGLSRQHVNVLVANGEIVRYARGLLDRHSVDRYLAARSGGRTRAWAEHTAWGAIALLSGAKAPWLGPVQRSRLRADLGKISDDVDLGVQTIGDLITRLRDRAKVNVYSGHRSAIPLVSNDVIEPGRSRLGLVGDDDLVDGYLATDALTPVVRRYRLGEDPAGSVILRTTGFDLMIIDDLVRGSTVLAAIDAATSVHPRERGVGERTLAEALAREFSNAASWPVPTGHGS